MAAKGGDVQAARELRAWKAEHPLVDESIKLEDQPAVIRQRLLKRLLAELAEEDAQDGRGSPAIEETASPSTGPEYAMEARRPKVPLERRVTLPRSCWL